MIEVKNISKRYGTIKALQNVSFTAEKGTILGFLGPNGAGKSTTMNIITGYLSPTSGSVTVGGHNILKEPRQAKALIGYLPEVPPLYTEMTVWEYLEFIYELKRVDAPKRKHLEEICDKVMLHDVQGRLIKNLSKGYQQRVGLAQALVGDPPVLILDEPTIGLDPQQIREIRSLIQQLGEKHTVLLSSHILPEIQAVCDQVMILNKGRIVADGTPESLASSLSGGGRLLLQVKGDPTTVKKLLLDGPGVCGIERGVQREKGVWEYTLTLEEGADPRQKLFEALAEARLPLLEMRSDRLTLEEIFLRLTAGDPAQEEAQQTVEEEKE